MYPFFGTYDLLRLFKDVKENRKMLLLVYEIVFQSKVITSNKLEYNRLNMSILFALMMKDYKTYGRMFNELLYHFGFILFEDSK